MMTASVSQTLRPKNVELPDSVWGMEKFRLFNDANISILTSYYENFPLVVLEAAAAGHAPHKNSPRNF